jgi:hypothetical protein
MSLHYYEFKREKWQDVVAEKDAAFTAALMEKDAELTEQATLIAELRKQIREGN